MIKEARQAMGGQIQPLVRSQTRWYLADVETAQHLADQGDMTMVAQLMRAARADGTLAGVLSTRTAGLVRLPKKFRGDEEIVAALRVGEGGDANVSPRSVFDEMAPPHELALMAADGELCGVAVGELVPVKGRDYPVLVRLDPEFLRYQWNDNTWYFRSSFGPIPITPGNGRWVLHTPGGRISPWQHGLWRAVGRAFIRKEHANLHKDNWEGKLANPARVATAPQGASDKHKEAWFQRVMAWGVNTVFGMTPGYEVKLLESNGRGWECFLKTIEAQNQELIIAIAGQTVTTDGGTGFANADIHKSIRADLIKATADALAFTVNTQILPQFVARRFGIGALARTPVMEWDVTPPKDQASAATSLEITARAITALKEALNGSGQELDIPALCSRFGIPVKNDFNGDGLSDKPVSSSSTQVREPARNLRAA